jgi:hypothetical protein
MGTTLSPDAISTVLNDLPIQVGIVVQEHDDVTVGLLERVVQRDGLGEGLWLPTMPPALADGVAADDDLGLGKVVLPILTQPSPVALAVGLVSPNGNK